MAMASYKRRSRDKFPSLDERQTTRALRALMAAMVLIMTVMVAGLLW